MGTRLIRLAAADVTLAGGALYYVSILADQNEAIKRLSEFASGSLLSTDGVAYEVAESDIGGRLIRTFRRDVPRARIPARMRSDSTRELRQRLDTISVPLSRVIGLPDSVRLGLLPEYYPSIVDVLTSQSGARVVWRWTFRTGAERTEFDFFSRDGNFLGTGTTAAALARRPKPIIACGLLLGVIEDANTGEQVVVRTRLDRCW